MNKLKNIIRLLLAGFVLLVIIGPALAEDYYVSTSGSDSNSGTTSSPFKTIDHAVDECDGGDTVYVKSGTYIGGISISESGTKNSYNTLTNYNNDDVTIRQNNIYDHGIMVHANYWNIEGFEITNTWHPVMVCGGQHDINMRNLECHYNGYSLVMNDGSHDLLVEDCTFYDPYSDSTNFIGLRGEDDYISHHITIRDCDFDGCIHNSINAYTSKSNEHYAGLTDVLIEGCTFSNGRQVAIFGNWMGFTRMTVRDCHFDHYARGIQTVMRDCLIEDCTVEDHGSFFVYTPADADSWNVTVQNIEAHSGNWGNSAPCVNLIYGHDFYVHNIKATGDFSETSNPSQTKDNGKDDSNEEIIEEIEDESDTEESDDSDAWKEEWYGEDSDEGTTITTTEYQEAVHHWLEDIPIRGHILTTPDIQMIAVDWMNTPETESKSLDWRDEWTGEDTEEGKQISRDEMQNAIDKYLGKIPVREHTITKDEIYALMKQWREQ